MKQFCSIYFVLLALMLSEAADATNRPMEIPQSIACLSADQRADFYAKSKVVAYPTSDVIGPLITLRTTMYLRLEELVYESGKRVKLCEASGAQQANAAYCSNEKANMINLESRLEKFAERPADHPETKKLADEIAGKLKKLRADYPDCEN
jgi:hypothetical protein